MPTYLESGPRFRRDPASGCLRTTMSIDDRWGQKSPDDEEAEQSITDYTEDGKWVIFDEQELTAWISAEEEDIEVVEA